MAAKPFPTQLLLLRNSIHIRLSVEIKTSGTLSPQNLPVKNTHMKNKPCKNHDWCNLIIVHVSTAYLKTTVIISLNILWLLNRLGKKLYCIKITEYLIKENKVY